MDFKQQIICIFNENGIDPLEQIQLKEIDSIQYISIIVEIEQLFGIVLPDFLLMRNEFVDFEAFINVVAEEYRRNNENELIESK